ncbi:MAG: 50S ribosomal protein L2, partial [Candidatus Aenigmatarchaeota archaeon]
NILPLGEIPEGVPVYNIESHPGDGGKFARSSGVYGFVVTHDAKSTIVRLPSKKVKEFSPECRATIGVVSGGGRTDKPFMKAGNKSKALKARGRQYPIVSGVSMNAVDHPFGGSTKPGKPKTVSRNASPGRKVGSFGAKRSGKKKR